MMKKGSQQMTKAPVMIASVFAAFLSRLESAASFFLFGGWYTGVYTALPGSQVGKSGSTPFP